MATRSINAAGLDLIKTFEGLATEAYVDPVGILTIGYGHTENVKAGQTISAQEADELLMKDLGGFERGVANLVKVAINDNEFSALVSFAYNVGLASLKGSTALKRLNAGDVLGAADALEWWNKGKVNGKLYVLPGLARRRAAEKALFLLPETTGAPATTLGTSGRVPPTTKESPNVRDNLASSRTIQGGGVAGAAAVAGGAGALSQAITKGDEAKTTGETSTPAPETTTAPPPETTPPAATPPATTPPATTPPPSTTAPATTTTAPAPTAGTTTTTLVDKTRDTIHKVGGLFDQHPELYTIIFGLIVLGVIYVIWARIDDWKNGRR